MLLRRTILAGMALVFVAASGAAHAADAPASLLSNDDKAMVQAATDYFQNLKAAQGKFTQVDPKGQVSAGTFYIDRPGKARFQYDPPAALLVVADGSNVSIYDRKLKSFDQYPLAQTPLALILSKTVTFNHGIVITAVDKTKDGFVISARDSHKDASGRLDIAFSKNPVTLRGWTVVDGQGQKTEVRLGALTGSKALDPNLFILRDPTPQAARP